MAPENDDTKGGIAADIPASAVEEALRSVEKRGAKAEVEVEIAPPDSEETTDPALHVPPGLQAGAPAAEPSAGQLEVDSLKAQLEYSQQKSRETLDKLREEHEKYLRAAADLENYKKRAAKEKDEIQKFGSERMVKDFLPVIDNLDRALAHAAKDDPLTDGVKMVLRQFEDALAKHGVTGFSAMGQPFDPRQHEAMQQVPDGTKPPGTVVVEHARGFTMHGRLLRPAMVGVAAPPPAEGAPKEKSE